MAVQQAWVEIAFEGSRIGAGARPRPCLWHASEAATAPPAALAAPSGARPKIKVPPVGAAAADQSRDFIESGQILLRRAARPRYKPARRRRSAFRVQIGAFEATRQAAVENDARPFRTLARDSSASVDSFPSTTTSRAADLSSMRRLLNRAGFPVARGFVIQAMRRRIAASHLAHDGLGSHQSRVMTVIDATSARDQTRAPAPRLQPFGSPTRFQDHDRPTSRRT